MVKLAVEAIFRTPPVVSSSHQEKAPASRFLIRTCIRRVRSRLMPPRYFWLPDIPWEPGALHMFSLLNLIQTGRYLKQSPRALDAHYESFPAYWAMVYARSCVEGSNFGSFSLGQPMARSCPILKPVMTNIAQNSSNGKGARPPNHQFNCITKRGATPFSLSSQNNFHG